MPSRPPRSALGLDGVAGYAPDVCGEPRTQFDFQREACTTRAIQSLDWEMTDRQAQIFGARFLSLNTTPLPSQSEVRGSRRALTPPTLAKRANLTSVRGTKRRTYSLTHAFPHARRLVGRGADGLERGVLVGDLVDGGEEGELVLEALHLEHVVDLLGRERALQLLAAQQLGLNLIERLLLARLGEGLCALAIAAAIASRDQIRHAAALEEGVVVDIFVEHVGKLFHLQEANAHDGSLGVAAVAKAVDVARADGHDVLQSATQLNTHSVLHDAHLEGRTVESLLEKDTVGVVLPTESRQEKVSRGPTEQETELPGRGQQGGRRGGRQPGGNRAAAGRQQGGTL
eukprot:scaffold132824_cov30-Phaeocystis_antarctica.AAC.1